MAEKEKVQSVDEMITVLGADANRTVDIAKSVSAMLKQREDALDGRTAAVLVRESVLQERETKVANREAATEGLRTLLSDLRCQKKTCEQEMIAADRRAATFKKERDDLRNRWGRLKIALPGIDAMVASPPDGGNTGPGDAGAALVGASGSAGASGK